MQQLQRRTREKKAGNNKENENTNRKEVIKPELKQDSNRKKPPVGLEDMGFLFAFQVPGILICQA